MPFGSRRFFTGRTINPEITTISFDSPQGAGSSQPLHFPSATVSGDTAGNTLNGNGTYTSTMFGTGVADLPKGVTGGANNPIVVPLTEGRTYTIRLRKTTHRTIANGIHPTASYPYTDTRPRVATVVGSAGASNPVNIVSTAPTIEFIYSRVRNNAGTPAYQSPTSIFQLVNHDRSSDAMAGAGNVPAAQPQTHVFNFTSTNSGSATGDNAMVNDTLTLSQNFTVASGDNDTASPGFTAKGLTLTYSINNFGSGHQANVVLELFQS